MALAQTHRLLYSLSPMPFPMAHPAAVLPFRRFCPRFLNFPALIVGSLSPDFGYFSGPFRLGDFSHRSLIGSFAFCLPAGLLVLLGFYVMRRPLVRILPVNYREVLLPLCLKPVGSPFGIVFSLLLGTWTHLLFDSMTHRDGWLAQSLPILQDFALLAGKYGFRNCDLVYAVLTFSGVLWLAVSYQYWLAAVLSRPALAFAWKRRIYAFLLAAAILCVALASRGPRQLMGFVPAGIIALLLIIGFILVTGRSVNRSPRQC